MKLQVDRSRLIRVLAHIQGVAEKRNAIPILANVLLTYRKGVLRLTATDTEIDVVEDVAVDGEREGSVTAPAAVLNDIVRKLPDGAIVEFDHPGGDEPLVLRSGRYATKLNVLPVDDFPTLMSEDLPCSFVLPAVVLRQLLDRTRFAISNEETRYYLNGIHLHALVRDNQSFLRVVATDGHRLARVEIDAPQGAETIPAVIVPRKTVNEIRKLLDEGSAEVGIKISDTRIQFRIGPLTLTSKLIDGVFPEYERVIPAGNDRILRVDKASFSSAVARVAAVSQDRACAVKLSAQPNLLTLSVTSEDRGAATEELDENNVTFDATPLEIGFQARYLNDITDQIESEVEFAFADSSTQALIRDTNDPSALFVLMPMRV